MNDLICKSEDRLMTNLERSDLWCFAARGWLGDIPGRRLAAVKQRIWGNFLSPVSGRVELEQLGIVRSHIFISHIIAVIRGWPGQAGWQGMSAQASQQPHRPTKTAPEYFNVLRSTQNIHSNGNFRNVIILSTFSEEFPLAARICVVLSSPRHGVTGLCDCWHGEWLVGACDPPLSRSCLRPAD